MSLGAATRRCSRRRARAQARRDCLPGGHVARLRPGDARRRRTPVRRRSTCSSSWRRSSALALAGGNATLGQGGTLGGLGHFSHRRCARNVVQRRPAAGRRLPDAAHHGRAAPAATRCRQDQIVGLPTADAAIGIFRAFRSALTNVGGIDLLVSATYVPDDRRRDDDVADRRRSGTCSSATACASGSCRSRSSCRASRSRTSSATCRRRHHRRRRPTLDVDIARRQGEDDRVARRREQEPACCSASPPASARTGTSETANVQATVRRSRRARHDRRPSSPLDAEADAHELLRRPVAQPPAVQARRRGRQVTGGDGRDVQRVRDRARRRRRAPTARWASASAC